MSTAELLAEISARLPTGTLGGIQASDLRQVLDDMVEVIEATGSSDPLNLAQYDGVPDCTAALQAAADFCFGSSASPHGNNAWLNKPFIIPPGQYNISSPITLKSVKGGLIKGAGRFATNITNTANGEIFQTNGFEYNRVQDMHLQTGHPGSGFVTIFNMDWYDGSVPLQSNTFHNVYFEGGDVGLGIGYSNNMGSENLVLNCYFFDHRNSGLLTSNLNALQNTVVGGNFASCGVGIYAVSGSVPTMTGVGFQGNGWDLQVDNDVGDCYVLNGCRSESTNHIKCTSSSRIIAAGSNHVGVAVNGHFASGNMDLIVDGCYSRNGDIVNANSTDIRLSKFDRSDYLANLGGFGILDGDRLIQSIGVSTYFLGSNQLDNRGQFFNTTSSSPQIFRITASTDPSWVKIQPGQTFEIAQGNTGQVTLTGQAGVSFLTAGPGLKTRARFSSMFLRYGGGDFWIVSGDTAA